MQADESTKQELIEEIIWVLEDLLPYLHLNTPYEGVDYMHLLANLYPELQPDEPYDSMLYTLYLSEVYEIWFLVNDWVVNRTTFEISFYQATRQTQLYENNQN
jgi:hypothetical protein